jgi:imidazolonepropionase-like amidohydrolase
VASISVTERARPTALCAAWLFDGTQATLRPDPVVVIEGSTIMSVGLGVAAPDDAHVVDLGGTTLMPGLIDTHVHLAFDASTDPVGALARRNDQAALEAMRRAGRTALLGGVTTVRDLGDRGYLSLDLRDTAAMPTVVAAGPPITTPGGHCHFLGGVAEPGADGIQAAVRQHAERGVDIIKIMASGGQLTPGTRQELPQFTVEELRAAVDEAHRVGLPVTAHAHAAQGIRNAVEAGVDGLEHATFWSEDGIDEPGDMIEAIARKGIVVGATVGLVPIAGVTPPAAVLKRMPYVIANTRRMQQAGVRVVAGTDAGISPLKPHDALRYAVPQLVNLGMTAADVLMTITSVAAKICGLAHRKGRIAVGYDADILAIEGDPARDPGAIHRVRAVYRTGNLITPSS